MSLKCQCHIVLSFILSCNSKCSGGERTKTARPCGCGLMEEGTLVSCVLVLLIGTHEKNLAYLI